LLYETVLLGYSGQLFLPHYAFKLSKFLLFIRFDPYLHRKRNLPDAIGASVLAEKSIHDSSLHGRAALDAHVHASRNINAIGVRLMQLHAQRLMFADKVPDAIWMIFGRMRSGLLFL
jgi:hypothetical protein